MYNVREIQLGDLFPVIRILKKIDIKGVMAKMQKEDVTGKSEKEKGEIAEQKAIEFVVTVISQLDTAEEDILTVLSGWAGCSKDEARAITISQLKKLVPEFLEKNSLETLKGFFTNAARQAVKN